MSFLKSGKRYHTKSKSKQTVINCRKMKVSKSAKKIAISMLVGGKSSCRINIMRKREITTKKYKPLIENSFSQNKFTIKEIEFLQYIKQMMNTPDEKGKEWWDEYDKEFEKYRFRI